MRTGRPTTQVKLTPDEPQGLDSLQCASRRASRSHHPRVRRRWGDHPHRQTAACLGHDGLQVADALSGGSARRAVRRTATGRAAANHRRSRGASDYPDAGKHTTRRHAVEHARDGEGEWLSHATISRIWHAFSLQPAAKQTEYRTLILREPKLTLARSAQRIVAGLLLKAGEARIEKKRAELEREQGSLLDHMIADYTLETEGEGIACDTRAARRNRRHTGRPVNGHFRKPTTQLPSRRVASNRCDTRAPSFFQPRRLIRISRMSHSTRDCTPAPPMPEE